MAFQVLDQGARPPLRLDWICGDSVRAEREEVGQQANGFAMAPRCGLLQQV
jgi:hypothetical protein